MQIIYKPYHLIGKTILNTVFYAELTQILEVMFIWHDPILKRSSSNTCKEEKIVQFLITMSQEKETQQIL